MYPTQDQYLQNEETAEYAVTMQEQVDTALLVVFHLITISDQTTGQKLVPELCTTFCLLPHRSTGQAPHGA